MRWVRLGGVGRCQADPFWVSSRLSQPSARSSVGAGLVAAPTKQAIPITVRIGSALVALLATAVIGTPVGLGAATPRPAKRCPTQTVLRVVNGVRSCVGSSTLRRPAPTLSVTARAVGEALTPPFVVRLKNGRPAPAISPKLIARLQLAYVSFETQFRVAEAAARAKGSKERGPLRRAMAGDPAVTLSPVTIGVDGTASGSATATFTGDGQTVTLQIGARVTASGERDLTIGVGTKDRAGNTKRLDTTLGANDPSDCPGADGTINLDYHVSSSSTTLTNLGASRVYKEAHSTKWAVTATAHLGDDAALQPFAISVQVSRDIAVSESTLLLNSLWRMGTSSTISGTLNPATGLLSGASVKTTGKGVGVSAANIAFFQKRVEDDAKDTLADVLQKARRVEENARGGKCLKIRLDPDSPGSLAPGATTKVRATVTTLYGGATPAGAKWTFTASKGRVSPATADGGDANLTVTGAPSGPQTAAVALRVVSRAGIAEAQWVANGTEPRRLKIDLAASFAGADEEAAVTVTGTKSYTVVLRANEHSNYDLPAPASWTITAATAADQPGKCILAEGAQGFEVTPQPANTAAVLRDGTATVFLFSALAVRYTRVRPMPPGDCGLSSPTGPGETLASTGVQNIPVPLGVPTRFTGGDGLGTYDITVTVTALPD